MKLTPTRAFAPAVLVSVLAVGAGCAGGSGSDAGGSTADVASSGSGAGATAERSAEELAGPAEADGRLTTRSASNVDLPETALGERALIRHGNVSLRSHDVGKAQFEVQKVVDRYGGQVTEEETATDDDGAPAYTRMVLRIPSEDFAKAMEALKGVAELESADTSEDDVTTKMIDTRTRLKVQRRSIDRITTLFDRAESIRDIMAIEAQLSRRQAELDSLERQAAYLANQTSMSTITVSVDQIPEKKPVGPKDDDAGFLAGLSAGWHGLTTFAVALATVAGALLPWLVMVAVVGPPMLLLVRALRRRRADAQSGPAPAEG